MSLRIKTILILLGGVAILLVALHQLLSPLVLDGFAKIEIQGTQTDLERAEAALQAESEHLGSKQTDWAYWDDSYKFMQDHNRAFIKSNLMPSALEGLEFDHIVFYDLDLNAVVGVSAEDSILQLGNPRHPVHKEIIRQLALSRTDAQGFKTGLIYVNGEIMLGASRWILDNSKAVPPRGLLVFLRRVSPQLIQEMAARTRLRLSVALPVNGKLQAGPQGIADQIERARRPLIIPRSQSVIAGYALMQTVSGEKGLLLMVERPRHILMQGLAVQRSLLIATAVACLIITLLIIVGLERYVLKRLVNLAAQVKQIAAQPDSNISVAAYGTDEIGFLASQIHALLSARNEIESSLKRAKEHAEEAAKSKAHFLANMSHEIRTPLNGILGMAQVMLNVEKSDQRRESLNLIKASAQSLLEIINQILDLSKLDAAKLELAPHNFELRSGIFKMLRAIAIRAHEKGIRLLYQVEADVPKAVKVDSLRLQQIIFNLVGNAIKFTERGTVELKISKIKDLDQSRAILHFEVNDTGSGIPENKLETIFDAFTQASSDTARLFGGTGLGLSISKQLVELMQGRIWAANRENGGATFCFNALIEFVPGEDGTAVHEEVRAVSEADLRVSDMDQIQGGSRILNVLVVDDSLVNRTVLKSMLEQWGHSVDVADTGKAAISKLQAAGNFDDQILTPHAFNLVLMDIQMPELDGLQATQLIRERERNAQKSGALQIVACSANTLDSSLHIFGQAGMNNCLPKPIDQQELAALLSEIYPDIMLGEPHEATRQAVQLATRDGGGVIDAKLLFERFAFDAEIITEVIQAFLLESGTLYHELELAVNAWDSSRIVAAAHALKGSLSNISATNAAEQLVLIESAGKVRDIPRALKLFAPLKSELDAIRAVVQTLLSESQRMTTTGPSQEA